ncbi:MAG: hypothetical protein KBH11_05280 [Bacteroidia bacterium]|nr:hypothetical protein [Bacteroidia bacterium]
MKKQKKVEIPKEDLIIIAQGIQNAFDNYSGKKQKLGAYKDSENYYMLSKAIRLTSGTALSISMLRDIITLKHNGRFQFSKFDAIQKFILTYSGKFDVKPINKEIPVMQKIFWTINPYGKAGVYINAPTGEFIPWIKVKKELEEKVLPHCTEKFPPECFLEKEDFYQWKDLVIRIYNQKKKRVGDVWIGGDPLNNFYPDGFVRLGKVVERNRYKVFYTYRRYSDGSYHAT